MRWVLWTSTRILCSTSGSATCLQSATAHPHRILKRPLRLVSQPAPPPLSPSPWICIVFASEQLSVLSPPGGRYSCPVPSGVQEPNVRDGREHTEPRVRWLCVVPVGHGL
uniref:Putative secreted protein n=1 Tax=Anopheles marajoara TaxID=58244 RepID=A0A2M4C871_9DIPT